MNDIMAPRAAEPVALALDPLDLLQTFEGVSPEMGDDIEELVVPAISADLDPQPWSADGYDPEANQLAPEATRRYVRADERYFERTQSHMDIHSGRRTVQRQAELYVRHRYHGQGNPASWPGCSFHNWGLAVDMVRTHEAILVEVMRGEGWTRTVGDEGWHFECTGAGEHATAATRIAGLRKPSQGKAWLWSEQVALYYQKTRELQQRVPPFNQRVERHRAETQALRAAIDAHNRGVDAWKQRADRYNRAVEHYNAELARAKALVDQINSMPAGPARDRKIREFRQLEAWLRAEQGRLQSERAVLQREQGRLQRERAALDARVSAWRAENQDLQREHAELTRLRDEAQEHERRAGGLLGEIQAAVGS